MPMFDPIAALVAESDSEESEDRLTLDNVIEFSKTAFTSIETVTHGDPLRFERRALNARRLLEGRIERIRERMRPFKDEEAELLKRLGVLDALIIQGWDAGARTTDGAVEVVEVKPRQSWSGQLVEDCCKILGVDFDGFLGIAKRTWRPGRAVKQYK